MSVLVNAFRNRTRSVNLVADLYRSQTVSHDSKSSSKTTPVKKYIYIYTAVFAGVGQNYRIYTQFLAYPGVFRKRNLQSNF